MIHYVLYMPEGDDYLCRSVTVRNGETVQSSAYYSSRIPYITAGNFRVRVTLKTSKQT